MKHRIMGVVKGDDSAVFEQALSISTSNLKVIMGWSTEEDLLYDYKLTEQQITDIEQACAVKLPRHLDLYLSTEDR
ncbi:hypothetical protein [Pseudomonas siliginis]|uniref:Transcriptional regulator n=1 Tax=Pseudomonas siliginis TaxID=2842346 RepID=A0ABY5CK33_9PSED|nr:hypothetical protein [Pseudomonas siliginis]UST86247.1 hypothetical protein NF677_06090 [Pseudomonas siliginis]